MKNGRKRKLSRRNFLLKGGVAALAALAASVVPAKAAKMSKKAPVKKEPPAPAPAPPPDTLSQMDITFTLNGSPKTLTVPAGRTLAEVLRDDLGLTGTKIGCGSAECGACTVIVNSRPVYSCNFLAILADQAWIETIEGLSTDGTLHPIQRAFVDQDALQCGYCTPGMICASKALLMRSPNPSEDEIREALAGNLCRCGAYRNIVAAVASVPKK